jgi:lipopolysaccharide biosynthesis protein
VVQRLCVFAHFSEDQRVKAHILNHLRELRKSSSRLVFVSTSPMNQPSQSAVAAICDDSFVIPNVGYDFWMWKQAFVRESDAGRSWSEVVLTNSSVVGPVGDLASTFVQMSASHCDWWGMNESDELESRCFQSYFFCFKSAVLRSSEWKTFWSGVEPLTDKWQVIFRYELGLSVLLRESGFVSTSRTPIAYRQGNSNPTHSHTEEMIRSGCHYVKITALRAHPQARLQGILRLMEDRGYDVSLLKDGL